MVNCLHSQVRPRKHNRVVTNLVSRLDNQLLSRPCNVYANDMKVCIPATSLYLYSGSLPTPDYTYPDVVVTCGDENYLDDKE